LQRELTVKIDENERIVIDVPNNQKPDMVKDMALLCEAVCTLIHLANKEGVKSDYLSLEHCVKHLQDGFVDETYKTKTETS